MKTRIGASVHVDPSEITHSAVNGSPVLSFGPWPTVERVDVFLGDVAGVDAVIAELTALRAEMTAEPATDPVYRLDCGCTDWCTCDRCRAGKIHDTGSGWHCDNHGRTTVAGLAGPELKAAKQATDVKCLDKYDHIGNTDYCQRDKGHDGQHAGHMGRRWNAAPLAVAS